MPRGIVPPLRGRFYPISHCPAQSIGYAVIDGQDKQESYEIY
ncbi:hypothetical protein N172_21060 [Pantoea dispersa EGD-AAK13]|nr:hypothetical protein N172_21060 [Pantoea dispersa EGD-AAK13]